MSKGKISIISIIYRVEDFLPQAIESMLRQTYSDLEIILCVGVGGDEDASLSICEDFAARDSRIKIIKRDADKGQGYARNLGLEAATGRYIGFVDGDDFIEEDMYERLLDNLIKYDADISVCGKYSDYEDASIPDRQAPVRVMTNRDSYEMLLRGNGFFFHCWDKLYKKEIFDGLTFPGGYLEDRYVIGTALYRSKRTVYDTTPLYHYRIRSDSGSRIIKMSEYNTDANTVFCAQAKEQFPELSELADATLLYDHITNIQNYLIYFKGTDEDNDEMRERYRSHLQYVRDNKNKKNPEVSKKLKLKVFMTLYMKPLLRLVTKKRVEKQKSRNEVFKRKIS
ncbi:MAG: glycosyltransferase [Lachnospiraceae bacterium]|nr:glycosyltransferase [Lachnospiraceae bacterium]